jgi:hypothetical protein
MNLTTCLRCNNELSEYHFTRLFLAKRDMIIRFGGHPRCSKCGHMELLGKNSSLLANCPDLRWRWRLERMTGSWPSSKLGSFHQTGATLLVP